MPFAAVYFMTFFGFLLIVSGVMGLFLVLGEYLWSHIIDPPSSPSLPSSQS